MARLSYFNRFYCGEFKFNDRVECVNNLWSGTFLVRFVRREKGGGDLRFGLVETGIVWEGLVVRVDGVDQGIADDL
jgi:hypothetical protein